MTTAVNVGGVEYELRFLDLLPRVGEAKFAEMEADILANGIKVRVSAKKLVDEMGNETILVVDGNHRVLIAKKHGLEIPIDFPAEYDAMDEAELELRAWALNSKRRHLDPAELARVASKLEAEGLSRRAAAAKMGVPESTIRKAQNRTDARSGAHVCAPERTEVREEEAPKVIGADGKAYPAKPAPDDLATRQAAAKAARARGDSVQAIADMMGVSKATAHAYINAPEPAAVEGIDSRDGKQLSLATHAERALDRKHGTLSGPVTKAKATTTRVETPAEPPEPDTAPGPTCDLCEQPSPALVPDGYGQNLCAACFVPEAAADEVTLKVWQKGIVTGTFCAPLEQALTDATRHACDLGDYVEIEMVDGGLDCPSCEELAAALVVHAGKLMCEDCAADALDCQGCGQPAESLVKATYELSWRLAGKMICHACVAKEEKRKAKERKEEEKREKERREREAAEKAAIAHLKAVKVAPTRWHVFETVNDRQELLGFMDQGTAESPGQKGLYTAQVLLQHEGRRYDRPLRDGAFWTQAEALQAMAKARKNPAKFLEESRPKAKFHDQSPRPKTAATDEGAEEKPPKKPRGPHSFSDIDFSRWKDYEDLPTTSFWDLGPRAKGPGRKGDYHGNFVPQIPDFLMRRYTKAGDLVADFFLGGATSMVEAVRLGRHFVGFDLQQHVVEEAGKLLATLDNPTGAQVALHAGDSSGAYVAHLVRMELERLGLPGLGHFFLHPPYWKAIRFAQDVEADRDLSWAPTLQEFLSQFASVVWQALPLLMPGRFFTLVMGDGWDGSEYLTLGSDCKDVVKAVGGKSVKLKAHITKKIQGNEKGAGKNAPLKRYRHLWNGTFEFSHEHIYIFQKVAELTAEEERSDEAGEGTGG